MRRAEPAAPEKVPDTVPFALIAAFGGGLLLAREQPLDCVKPVAEVVHVLLQPQQMGKYQLANRSTGIETRGDNVLKPHPGFIVHVR